jgi:uncharacterized oligopeptide transporter (OPT) family protein
MSGFIFLRNYQLFRSRIGEYKVSLIDLIIERIQLQDWFSSGSFKIPSELSRFFSFSLPMNGLYFGIGWFLRSKSSMYILAGSILSSLIIVPLAVLTNMPVGITGQDKDWIGLKNLEYSDLIPLGFDDGSIAALAFNRIAIPIAIGAIIGSGIAVLLKYMPIFKNVAFDIARTEKEFRSSDELEGGRIEWSTKLIIPAAIATMISFIICFLFIFPSNPILTIIFSFLMVFIVFFLGIISCKTTGETGLVPTSIISLLLFTFLMVLIWIYLYLTGGGGYTDTLLLMAILTTTIFTCSIAMSSDILWDFKTGLYAGVRPSHLFKGQTLGLVIGLPFAALSSLFLLEVIFGGVGAEFSFAPQAQALAFWANAFVNSNDIRWNLLILGIFIGALAEFVTGRGMAFSLGMYLSLSIPLLLMIGGGSRDLWENKWLQKKVEENGWDDSTKMLKIFDSYLIMIGLIIAEVFFGSMLLALMLVFTG